jgi:hypothetical protein
MARLENEIRATARLWQMFGGASYPAHLPRLLGFDLASAEPYALFAGYTGRPLADLHGRLDAEAAQRVWSGLVSALLHTTAAGIVHGNVGLPSVWWDGATAQLVLFDNATTTQLLVPPSGKPRRGEATLVADPDVQAGGEVLTQTTDGSSLPRSLRKAIKSTCRPPGKRPTATALARKAGVPAVVARTSYAALDEGRRRFDTIIADKSGRPRTRLTGTGRTVLVLGALVVLLILVVVLVTGALS